MKFDIFKNLSLKFLIGEIAIFILLLYAIGYIFYKDDPLLMNLDLKFLFHLLPLTIITLFYGIVAGFSYFIIFTLVTIFTYGSIDYQYFLSLLLFLLVLSEFWFYWDKKLRESEDKYRYADEKLRDLSRNLLLVKLSHDQLERSYILKPISIRKLIFDIKKDILKTDSDKDILEKIFNLAVSNFNIEKGAIFSVKENEYELIANVGDLLDFDKKDPLVQHAFEYKTIAFIGDVIDKENTKYMSAMPFYVDDKIRYLLLIEKMPFLSLHKDNLLSINLLFDYVINDMEMLKDISQVYEKFSEFELDFIKEIQRMYRIYQKFGRDSTVVFLYIRGLEETVSDLINMNIRGLDVVEKIVFEKDGFQGLVILLPFTDVYGANIFINRIIKILNEKFSVEYVEKNLKYKFFKINDPAKLLLEFYDFEGFR